MIIVVSPSERPTVILKKPESPVIIPSLGRLKAITFKGVISIIGPIETLNTELPKATIPPRFGEPERGSTVNSIGKPEAYGIITPLPDPCGPVFPCGPWDPVGPCAPVFPCGPLIPDGPC